MSNTYLFELGCEEIPARFMPGLIQELTTQWTTLLTHFQVTHTQLSVSGTYRRLVVTVQGLESYTRPKSQRLRGPLASIAQHPDGTLLPPGAGFLKKNNLQPSHLKIEEENGSPYLVAYLETPGQPIAAVLPQIACQAIAQLPLPIAMKWGTNIGPFVRPVHWIVSLLDSELVPLELFTIQAGRTSYGHRFLTQNPNHNHLASGAPFSIDHANHYLSLLTQHKIQLHTQATREIEQALTSSTEFLFNQDPLLQEVTFLTEWPTALIGSIQTRYLALPQETIIACMKKHQKFFPVIRNSQLQPKFVVIADSVCSTNTASIIAGNERVLQARLEDVSFFWEEDCKTTLISKLEKLKTVTFQKGLGSLYDKVQRLKSVSAYLSTVFNFSETDRHHAIRTAELCKADLATHMVGELPELQGIMGRLYATYDGEAPAVCDGIESHYLSQASTTGLVVGLADRLDTLVACFCNGLIPTGSQDPWGVRRAVLGLISLAQNHHQTYPNVRWNFQDWIDRAYLTLDRPAQNQDACSAFVLQRIKSALGNSDNAEAVLHYALQDFTKAQLMSRCLLAFRTQNPDLFRQITDLGVRIGRLAQPVSTTLQPSLFDHPAEQTAYDAFQTEHHATTPSTFLEQLARLVPPLTHYFDHILVMSPNLDIRQNRLSFLHALHSWIHTHANFDKISL